MLCCVPDFIESGYGDPFEASVEIAQFFDKFNYDHSLIPSFDALAHLRADRDKDRLGVASVAVC